MYHKLSQIIAKYHGKFGKKIGTVFGKDAYQSHSRKVCLFIHWLKGMKHLTIFKCKEKNITGLL